MNLEPSDFGGLCFSRIVIVGANGAGKTWMALALAQALDQPVIHKDALALTKGWRQRDRATIAAKVLQQTAQSRWILEGGPSVLTPDVLARATLVVWLDMPGWLRGWRVLYRSLRFLGRTRPEHPAGNRDWPGPRQVRFFWRALVGGAQFRMAINAALADSQTTVWRVVHRSEVAALLQVAAASRA